MESIRIQLTGRGFDYASMNPQYTEQDERNYYIVFRNLVYNVKRLEEGGIQYRLQLTAEELGIATQLVGIHMYFKHAEAYFFKTAKPATHTLLCNLYEKIHEHTVNA